MRDINRTRLATAICCVGVVGIGLSFENSIFSLAIAVALCISSLSYGASVRGSHIKSAQLFLLNAGLVALIFVLFRATLPNVVLGFPGSVNWPWLNRIYRVWWLSERMAIILVLIAAGLVTIELAGKIGGDATQKKFRFSIIAATILLVAINIVHFLRPVWCWDCFFPYGLPFTLFTDGGYGGGGGFVWTGLIADAALIPAFAAICTVLWSQIA